MRKAMAMAADRTSDAPAGWRYLIALGSNRRHRRAGAPAEVLAAALHVLAEEAVAVIAVSPVLITAPLGPAQRRFANAAAIVATDLAPDALLGQLKAIERRFGRRRGRRWGPRVLDLDILLWSGGVWRSRRPMLIIPHPAYRQRRFVLDPAAAIAPGWRDPATGLSLAQQRARTRRPRPQRLQRT